MSFPLPGSGFIELGGDAFNSYTPGNYLTNEALWSGYDEAGGPEDVANQYRFKDQGGASGVVAFRATPSDDAPERYHIVVLQSGFTRGDGISEYPTVSVQADAYLSGNNLKSNFHLYMRPSGVGHAAFHGYRLLWNRRDDYNGKDYFSLYRMVGGTSVAITGAHGATKYEVAKTDSISICGVDNGGSLVFYALHPSSGSWQEVFRTNTTTYNDHPYSGSFSSTSITNETINHGLNNVVICGVPSAAAPSTASGTTGGYICGLTSTSGSIGGYVSVLSPTSGQIGGYLPSVEKPSGTIGGYIYASLLTTSGNIGGYLDAPVAVSPEVFTTKDSSIFSWWYGNEGDKSTDLLDYGSAENDLPAQVTDFQNIVSSGVQTPYQQRAHARFLRNAGTGTDAKFKNKDMGDQYVGDKATNFTIMGWVYPSGYHIGEIHPIVSIQRDDQTINNSMRWQLELFGAAGKPVDRLRFAHRWGASAGEIDYPDTVANTVGSGQFIHVAAVYNKTGGDVRLYVNGACLASGAITGVMGSGSADDIAVGGNPNPAYMDFVGGLNDILFVTKALTPGQIAYVAQSGIGPTPTGTADIGGYLDAFAAAVTANEEQTQAVWRLDETDDDATRVDSSTKGNHLDIITGSPEQVPGRRGNGTRFQHWENPFPCLQRTGSGVSTGLDPVASDWTMGMWVKPSGGAHERRAQLAGKGSYDQYVLYIDEQGEVWGQVSIDGIGYVVASQPSSLINNEWQHIDWVVDRAEQVQYLYRTAPGIAPTIIGSGALPSASKLQDTTTEPFHIGASPTNTQVFDGDLDEVYFIQRALTSGELISIYKLGLPTVTTTGVSGSIGGYLDVPVTVTPESGQVGGYINGIQSSTSGEVGGYVEQLSVASGVSGQIGGYVDYDFANASGQIGGYTLYTQDTVSGQVGGYVISEGFDEPSAFLSYFNFVSPEALDFDLIARIGSAETNDFDARLRILRQYTPPTVTCYVTGSGTVDGFYHVTVSGTVVVGDVTIQNGAANSVENVWIQFGNMSGQKDITPSDGVFEVNHTFDASGVYIIRVDAIDKQGSHGGCYKRVDLSVGLASGDIIQLDLSGTPQSGVVPHTVAFTQSYTAQPIGVKESIINFGDRTLSHLDDPVHIYHSVGNYIPVWIVRDDNGRFWCDTLALGINQ